MKPRPDPEPAASPGPSSPVEDGELWARFRAGERQAFDELVRRHERAIFRLALRYLGEIEDARDVAQRTFVQAFRQAARFRGDARFRTWIYRIAVNLSVSALRERGRARRPIDPGPATTEAAGTAGLAEREERARLRAAVARLPPKQRLVVELRVFEELSFREVAEVAGTSEDGAKVNFHHALVRLREILKEKDEP